jgi:outer membrane protein assembly factor BamD (BamD/ComL family)
MNVFDNGAGLSSPGGFDPSRRDGSTRARRLRLMRLRRIIRLRRKLRRTPRQTGSPSQHTCDTSRQTGGTLRDMSAPPRNIGAATRNVGTSLPDVGALSRTIGALMRTVGAPLHKISAPLHNINAPLRIYCATLRNRCTTLHIYCAASHISSTALHIYSATLHIYSATLRNICAALHIYSAGLHKRSAALHNICADMRNIYAALRNKCARLRNFSARVRKSSATLHNICAALRKTSARLRKTSARVREVSASAFGLLLVSLAAGAGMAWGCGWGGFENSVRFNGATERCRSRLPPLPSDVKGAHKDGPEDDEAVSSKQRAAEIDKLWEGAGEAVAGGALERARELLKRYVEGTAGAGCDEWESPHDCRGRRNSAFDRLDALDALDHGSQASAVRAYLDARDAYDGRPASEQSAHTEQNARQEAEGVAAAIPEWASDLEGKLAAAARDPNLADNVEYLRAAAAYRLGRAGDALKAFELIAARYPHGEKAEAALYMAGRVALESSGIYLDGETATSEEPCRGPDCRDESWTRARNNFSRLLEVYPRGRYSAEARGRLAYLDYRVGDKAGALVRYYRLLADAGDAAGQDLAVRSLRLARRQADDVDMDAVERELEDEPKVALTYAYHNIYNYAPGEFLRVPEVEEENPYASERYSPEQSRWQEHKEQSLRERAERKELRRTADFATRMMRRYPRAQTGGAFLILLAEAHLELGDINSALEAARRALSKGLAPDERGQALWVEGVAAYRLKDYKAARVPLARVIAEFPRGGFTQDARVLLAFVAEDAGDLAGALEQYLALGYDPDVAYFVDVLMTPDQLAAFVARQDAAAPHRNELLYALGLRYMRAGRYVEARAALARVLTAADSYDYSSSAAYRFYNGDEEEGVQHPKLHFRHTFRDEFGEGDGEYLTRTDAPAADPTRERDTRVYADWLLRDFKTLDDLERLSGEVERAQGDEAKAEATYRLASYFYEGKLLFYNPAAWRGMRAEMISSLDETRYRVPGEAQIVWNYEQEHEGPARALALYLEVVRRYPNTRAARDSLYTAILCGQQLANFNGYWREMDERGLHAGTSPVTLADLRRAYPRYRLPLAGDWKPSTRTVGGATAWPASPQPRRLTGMERARLRIRRAERRLAQGWELFGEIYGGRVRLWTLAALRWLFVALVAACVLRVFRRTRRARRFLYRQLARRHKTRGALPEPAAYAPKSSYAAHAPYTWGVGVRDAASRTAHGFTRLALHERGRAALVLNLFTHGLLTVLLWAVLWAMQ